MATHPKFARMANYSCKCVEASHIFSRHGLWQMWANLASPSKTGWRMLASLASPSKTGWQMSVNLAIPSKPGWRMLASLASPTHSKKGPFGRLLEFAKFAKITKSAKL